MNVLISGLLLTLFSVNFSLATWPTLTFCQMAASAVRRFLSSSPVNFSKSLSGDGRSPPVLQPYFGVPLSDIVRREGKSVPNLVTKIVSFILEHGE